MGSWQKLKDEGMEHLSRKEVKHPSSLLTISNDEYTSSSIEITVIQERTEAEISNEATPSNTKPLGAVQSVSKDTSKQRTITRSFTDEGRKQTFDNIDYQQVVHHMNEEHQNMLHHWTSYMSTENRISGNHLTDDVPQGGSEDMENGLCIPNRQEHRTQRQNYIRLVSRICVEHISYLKPLSCMLPKHIPHVYSEQASQPTETVRFGFFYIIRGIN